AKQLLLCFRKSLSRDRTRGILDQATFESISKRIFCSIVYAIVSGQAHDENLVYVSLTQVAGQPGTVQVAVIIKSAVAVYLFVHSFPEYCRDLIHCETGMESGAMGALNTVIRPQYLFKSIQQNLFKGLPALMIRRKTQMIRRMPVLRSDDEVERFLQVVHQWNDLFTIPYFQASTCGKVILHIHY